MTSVFVGHYCFNFTVSFTLIQILSGTNFDQSRKERTGVSFRLIQQRLPFPMGVVGFVLSERLVRVRHHDIFKFRHIILLPFESAVSHFVDHSRNFPAVHAAVVFPTFHQLVIFGYRVKQK
jgi:hypothetical protein